MPQIQWEFKKMKKNKSRKTKRYNLKKWPLIWKRSIKISKVWTIITKVIVWWTSMKNKKQNPWISQKIEYQSWQVNTFLLIFLNNQIMNMWKVSRVKEKKSKKKRNKACQNNITTWKIHLTSKKICLTFTLPISRKLNYHNNTNPKMEKNLKQLNKRSKKMTTEVYF